ncbi:MAG: glycosyltransferase family 4 protein [Bryobacteraceae bacterium]
MKPIRVLLIGPSPDIVGGQSVQAARLLDRLGAEPTLEMRFLPINPRLPGPFRRLQKIKYVRTAATSLLYGTRLMGAIWRCDILHIFTAAYFSFLLAPAPAILLAKLLGKKTILNYRDGQAEDHLANWRTAVPVIKLVDAVVTPSGFLVKVFDKFGLRARSIFNVIDTGRFRYRERAHPRPVFLHNRGHEPLYNVECTLRAFALIQERYPNARLTVVHDGPLRGKLEVLARELHLRNVQFTGYVSQQQTPEVYDEADIYLTSPNIDNMPGSLLECFAAGLPVIATKAGGIPYILEDERTGLLVECNDHQAMAERAFRLMEEDGLALKLTRYAREECGKYTPDAVGREWLGLYRELRGE